MLAGLSWGILLLVSPGVSHMTTVVWQLESPRWSPHRSGALMLAVSGTSPSTWPHITWESSADLLTWQLEHSKNRKRKLQGFFLPNCTSTVVYQPNLQSLDPSAGEPDHTSWREELQSHMEKGRGLREAWQIWSLTYLFYHKTVK